MTDKKITELTETTSITETDLIPVVVNPSTLPETQKVTVENLFGAGWTKANETWTYASATTFTISGDMRTKYNGVKGMKIKLTQSGTTKYFYVLSVTYSAPNTTITITGGSDYTLSNEAITDNYYSRMDTPNGFPHWFNYNATLTGNGGSAGTYAESDTISRFSITGRTCHLKVQKHPTDKGSWSGNVQLSLPVASAGLPSVQQSTPCWWANGATPNAPKAFVRWVNGGNSVTFTDAFNASFFEWSEVAVNDWLTILTSYEI
jgi:hypothetical protein